MAGWIAALPLVTGPILFVIALERGAVFAAHAAGASLVAIIGSVAFGAAYSHCARRGPWPLALAAGMTAWLTAAAITAALPASPVLGSAVALGGLLTARWLYPTPDAPVPASGGGHGELWMRMSAGALLTLAVTGVADSAGPRWSGILAVFPLLSSVLAVFSHRIQGAPFAAAMLRGLALGLYSFLAFCLVLTLTLAPLGIAGGFGCAIGAALLVQAATRPPARLSP